jgi:hypothetical protein
MNELFFNLFLLLFEKNAGCSWGAPGGFRNVCTTTTTTLSAPLILIFRFIKPFLKYVKLRPSLAGLLQRLQEPFEAIFCQMG